MWCDASGVRAEGGPDRRAGAAQIVGMADTLSDGIIRRFPERFI
ncbi:hypothetical protein ACWCZ5_03800 [Streptomyces sp. NPDC001667]